MPYSYDYEYNNTTAASGAAVVLLGENGELSVPFSIPNQSMLKKA